MNNKKYLKVMFGTKSGASDLKYKIDEVNVSSIWEPSKKEPEEMGGFNFSTEDKILRWLHRGDTIYDVILPEDAEVIHVDEEKGIYRANKIIITNPRPVTDEVVISLCDKTTLSYKILAQCLVTLLWRKRKEISKYIIKKRVNLNNINEILNEFIDYAGEDNLSSETGKEIYDILKEIANPLLISLNVDKEPYIKKITDDKIINLTGQSGSGKSYFAKQYNEKEYLIIDTDDIFSEKRFEKSIGINKELGIMFRKKYEVLPTLGEDFDLIYNDILEYCKNLDKTIVIDCAQFHCVKNIDILKGQVIVMRTCIDTCYNRCLKRYDEQNPTSTKEEREKYANKKLSIYKWYKGSNDFLIRLDKLS